MDPKSDIGNCSRLNNKLINKSLLDKNSEKKEEKRIKSDVNLKAQNIDYSKNKNEPIASGSKDEYPTLQEDEETPDFVSDESECDMELKFEDEKDEEIESKVSTTVEERSSEEMF